MSSTKTARLVPQPDGVQAEEMVHVSSFAVVRNGDKVLLVRRVRPERWAGKWALPAAVINYGEDPAAAAKRVVKEQVGADATAVKLVDVQSYGDKHWDICFVYEVQIPAVGRLHQDVDKADWLDIGMLPPEVRDDHKEVLVMARGRKAI